MRAPDPEWHGNAPKPAEAVAAIHEILGGAIHDWAEPIIAELSALELK